MITLFESDTHKNVMFDDLSTGVMAQANQHLVVNENEAMLLDPGGHKVYPTLFPMISTIIPIEGLKHIFFSHQDPDIIAAANGWLMLTSADAYISEIWMRFIPHFGVDEFVINRIHPIPDEGRNLELDGCEMAFIPAHFLHSSGNFQVYDPIAKILYSGDLGASVGNIYSIVEDFEAHIEYMEGFHKRYIPTNKVLKLWAKMARTLDIDIIAPQHGAVFKGKKMVNQFIDWIENLTCGIDLMEDAYSVPGQTL